MPRTGTRPGKPMFLIATPPAARGSKTSAPWPEEFGSGEWRRGRHGFAYLQPFPWAARPWVPRERMWLTGRGCAFEVWHPGPATCHLREPGKLQMPSEPRVCLLGDGEGRLSQQGQLRALSKRSEVGQRAS